MPTWPEGLTSQGRKLLHSFGLCSLATWEAQTPPGELGPGARILVFIMGKLRGTRLGWPLQPSLGEHPGDGNYMSFMDSGSPYLWNSVFSMLPSLPKSVNPGWLIYLFFFRSVSNIVVHAGMCCPEPTSESSHSVPQLLKCHLLRAHISVPSWEAALPKLLLPT